MPLDPSDFEIKSSSIAPEGWTELPDVMDEWTDTIRSGALSRLFAMPGQPWSNPQAAAYYRALFEEGITQAKREARGDIYRPEHVAAFSW